jgi:hypothetical protein
MLRRVGSLLSSSRVTGEGPNYAIDALRLFAAMPEAPDAARMARIETAILALQSAGIWAKLDALWVMAAHGQGAALINWVAPGTHNLTAVNSITFTPNIGFTGNGTSMHLTIASPTFARLALNSATLFASVTGGTGTDAVIAPTVSGGSSWLVPFNGSNFQTRNNTTVTVNIGNPTSRNGRFVSTRNDAVLVSGYRNATLVSAAMSASIAVNTASLSLLRRGTVYSNDTIKDAGIGSGFSAQNVTDLETILNAYHTGL